jgi:lysozyme
MILAPEYFEKLQKLLLKEEGFIARPYRDSKGNLTIGIGWNLDARPMTQEQGLSICGQQVQEVENELIQALDCYYKLDDVRRAVLLDMAFQLGVTGLLTFKDMIALVAEGAYVNASLQMLSSDWGREFKTRANNLAIMMRTGEWL